MKRSSRARRSWWLTAIAVSSFGCGGRDATPPTGGGSSSGSGKSGSAVEAASPHDAELVALWELEKQQRATIDFATQPSSDGVLGSDPYRIVRVGDRYVGLLRGAEAVVLLDRDAKSLARLPVAAATALAALPDGDVLVAADDSVVQLRVAGDRLERVATLALDGIRDARGIAVAADGKTAYLVEERTGRLVALSLGRDAKGIRIAKQRELGRCHGPVEVQVAGDLIVTNCLLDRTLELRRGDELQRIQHDGPLWGFALHRDRGGNVLLAAGGVEDHPLERADGGFGYIDSYLFLYKIDKGAPSRLAAINVSEHRAITPKWVAIVEDDAGLAVETAGFGGGRRVTATWPGRAYDHAPQIRASALPPGTTDAVAREGGGRIYANPLFDGWVVEQSTVAIVPVDPPGSRTLTSRVGELLFFTELMAPWGATEGKRSRFTCETCHHEGYVDGRTHFTGRELAGVEVHATTRPLLGLFNNAPYFSRALDQTMTQMVHSEFKVANRHNGRDPWFSLSASDIDWWPQIAGMPRSVKPEWLREAFMRFLIDFTHRRNRAAAHAAFTPLERRGAETFRDRCASCHAARLIAEEPSTEVPFERWEKLVLSAPGPLVWNNAAYARTGVEPYVHDQGTRVPSLRRLYKKWPYFTNGSAKSLAELLDRFAYDGAKGQHDHAAPAMTRLTAAERAALLAFLELL